MDFPSYRREYSRIGSACHADLPLSSTLEKNHIVVVGKKKKKKKGVEVSVSVPPPRGSSMDTINRRSDTAGKSIRCKAAICRKAGEPLSIEEIEVEPPRAWEVRIKILCTSLCHSDLSTWKFEAGPFNPLPRIFGHEAVGVVESVGEKVDEVKEGDTVLPVFHPNCGACRGCKSSKGNSCSAFSGRRIIDMPRDETSRFKCPDGEVVHHFLGVSSFSEYTVVDIANIVRIDGQCPVDKACLLSCGVSTGVGAAWKVADVEAGSTVAIFGLGAIGLAVAEGARLRGASRIIGVDLNPDKFEIGKKFGVTDFINPSTYGDKQVSEIIKEMIDGGVDYSFECVGKVSLMAEAFASSREGWGKTVILGLDLNFSPLSLSTIELLKGRSLVGSFFGGFKPKSDIPLLAKKYLDKELNLDDFITQEVNFGDINKAFELLVEGKSIRCIIWMDK